MSRSNAARRQARRAERDASADTRLVYSEYPLSYDHLQRECRYIDNPVGPVDVTASWGEYLWTRKTPNEITEDSPGEFKTERVRTHRKRIQEDWSNNYPKPRERAEKVAYQVRQLGDTVDRPFDRGKAWTVQTVKATIEDAYATQKALEANMPAAIPRGGGSMYAVLQSAGMLEDEEFRTTRVAVKASDITMMDRVLFEECWPEIPESELHRNLVVACGQGVSNPKIGAQLERSKEWVRKQHIEALKQIVDRLNSM